VDVGERMQLTTSLDRSGIGPAAGWLTPLALFAAAGLLYAVNLDRMPHPDEYYHILAAQGVVATGEPRIAEGLYTRVYLHTWLVAKSFLLFGESLAAARVPSLVAMAALVSLLFVWSRREAGSLAAWIGTGLFALSPFAVDVAQFSRFYALQALAFFAAAAIVFAAVAAPPEARPRRLGLLLLGGAPMLLAIYLQPTTLFGCVGLGLWAAAAIGLPWLGDRAVPRRRKLLVAGGLGLLALAVLAAAAASGVLGDLWRQYRSTPLFNERASDRFWYYHAWYNLLYPSLWPATGVLALLAVVRRPLPASMALSVFAVGFLLNSFAASKSLRYIAYAQPFLFVLWGIGLAALWSKLAGFAANLRDTLEDRLLWTAPSLGGWMAAALTGGAVLFLVLANPAWVRTAMLLGDVTVPPEEPKANWPAAREALAPWLERADIVVTTEELGHLYFLGRYDVRFSPSKLGELHKAERREFGVDFRTGRPVIGSKETLERILACYPVGIIVGPAAHWGRPELINGELAALIAARAQPLPLPAGSHLRAYTWELPAGAAQAPPCAGLPSFPASTDRAG
jgi:hypothetical protein